MLPRGQIEEFRDFNTREHTRVLYCSACGEPQTLQIEGTVPHALYALPENQRPLLHPTLGWICYNCYPFLIRK